MSDAAAPPDGETDLDRLLTGMAPELDPRTYLFVCVPVGAAMPELASIVTVAEAEGTTLVVDRAQLDRAPSPDREPLHAVLRDAVPARSAPMARITLRVHSSLAAVGLTAAVATALSGAGISCNVVAGYHHDHLFVPAERAADALDVLRTLARSSTSGGLIAGTRGYRGRMTTPPTHPEDGPLEDAAPEAASDPPGATEQGTEEDDESPGAAIVRGDPAPEPNEPG